MNANILHDGDLTGGLSNYTLLIICGTGMTVVVSSLVLLCHRSSRADPSVRHRRDDEETYEEMLERSDVSMLTRAQRRARAKLLMKKNRKLRPEIHENVREPLHPTNDQNHNQGVNGQVNNTNELNLRTIASRKQRKEMAKELERQQRQIKDKTRISEQMHNIQKQKVQREKKLSIKSDIEKEEQNTEMIRQRLHRKYMFYSSERERRESLMTIHDFVNHVYKNPVQSITANASRLEVSVSELVDRLLQLEKEGRIPLLLLHFDNDCFSVVNLEHMKQIRSMIQDSKHISMEDIAKNMSNILQGSLIHT
jgi:hypothetical protein